MELSRLNLVEACDMGVVGGDDIASHLPWANASLGNTAQKRTRGTTEVLAKPTGLG